MLEILARAYARQIFVDGLFHADPHPGNLFVLERAGPGGPRVLFVDFGLSRRLDPALRREMRLGDLRAAARDRGGVPRRHGAPRHARAGRGAGACARRSTACSRACAARARRPLAARRPTGCSPLKDEAKALLEETPGLQLPNDLLLYAKTLSYLFALGAELAPEVDLMKLTVPWLLRFLAERDPAPAPARPSGAWLPSARPATRFPPALSASGAAAAAPAGG